MAMSARATDRVRRGLPTLLLQVGQPSTGAPAGARRAVIAELEAERPLGYTNSPGLPALAERIASHYHDTYAARVDPSAITIVSGASAGFTLAFMAAFDEGDRVGVIEPGYPCYRNTLLALGVTPVPIPVGPDTRWAPTTELLDAVAPLDGLVIASPSNPTGTVLDAASLDVIARYCDERAIQLIADEIYHGITYTEPAPTVIGRNDKAVVINSFSKYFSMTGWRLGWMVTPEHLREAVDRLQQNLYICASHVSQIAGLAAFDCGDELDAHVRRYAANRDRLIDGLDRAGIIDFAEADGAFYVYADVSHLTDDSMVLCNRWLDEIGVAATPGLDFDLSRGHRYVRFSYAGSLDHIDGACELLATWKP
ncbi:MAG: aspartate aminotransferase [Actinomycetota bacterium]|jgi:aspartate/methionine/tyrosine aminotransferase